jgi:hypothetical protein
MRITGYRTIRHWPARRRTYARTRDQRTGYLRLVLVSATTAALIALGLGIASLDRPLPGRHCSVPTATTHDETGLTLSCSPVSPGDREAVWQYVPTA